MKKEIPEYDPELLESIKIGLKDSPIWQNEALMKERQKIDEALANFSQRLLEIHTACGIALRSDGAEQMRGTLRGIESRCQTMAQELVEFSSKIQNKTLRE